MRDPLSHKRVRLILAACVGLAMIAWFLAIRRSAVVVTITWSALLFASFVGWGSLVNLWLARGHRMDWGLRAGWGMALALSTGGYLSVAHIAVRPVLAGQVILGVGLLLWTWAIRRPVLPSARRFAVWVAHAGVIAVVLSAYAIAIGTFFSCMGKHDFQPSDDPPLYFELPKKLLQTGTLYDPFNARRISTLGGQPYLHGLFLAVAPFYYLYSVDGGIALVLTVAILVGHFTRMGLKGWHAAPLGLALMVLFTLAYLRVNTASQLSGVPVILTIYRTLRVPLGADSDRKWPMSSRRLVALGALTVVAILMRTSNAPAVLAFVLLVLLSDFLLATRRPWTLEAIGSFVRALAVFSGAFALVLLPWSVMLKQSSGTFFYPLGQGNLTPGWTFLKPALLKQAIDAFVKGVSYDKPVSVFVPFIFAGFVPMRGRARSDVVLLTVASLVGVAALARQGGAFDAYALARYEYAFIVATTLVVAFSVERTGARAAIIATAVAMHIACVRDEIRSAYVGVVDYADRALREGPGPVAAFAEPTTAYAEVQSHLVPGATMVTAVHEPWRFDFKRNRIFTLDLLGGIGPKPGWPAFKGPEALIAYLRANGVRYVVSTKFDTANEFYNRAHWRGFLAGDSYLGGEAPFQLDGMDTIDQLATLRKVVYRGHEITVVDLDTAP